MYAIITTWELLTWKPLIMSTVISCPLAPDSWRTGTYVFNSASLGTLASARDFPTSSSRKKNYVYVSLQEQSPPRLQAHLRTEILDFHGFRIVYCNRLNTSEDHILGCQDISTYSIGIAGRCLPISTPKPFRPTMRTLDAAIRFIAVHNNHYNVQH